MPTRSNCPVCGRRALTVQVSSTRIHHESELREAFVNERLGYQPDVLESMDLTRFMHGGPARVLRCQACGLLFRDEAEQTQYESDAYDPVLLNHLYPRYVRAFESKKPQYREMLRNGAEVLEVGSHLGAFLQVAEDWGWRPTGLDIGEFTSAFARRRGLSVKGLAMEGYSPRLRRPEAIFIWNCFEQLKDPFCALRRAHQLLDRHGVLVVRVPNADFYRAHGEQLEYSRQPLRMLGYNNLLGFPYLHGYTSSTLHALLRANGFQPIAAHNGSLLTPPYPDVSSRVRQEWWKTRRRGEIDGPWIEIVSRRYSEETSQRLKDLMGVAVCR